VFGKKTAIPDPKPWRTLSAVHASPEGRTALSKEQKEKGGYPSVRKTVLCS
jgi:hypothetical protein